MHSHADRVCTCRRPGFRSTAEHLLTVCKDKVDAVPRLAQDYEQLVLAHAQVRHPALYARLATYRQLSSYTSFVHS